MWYIAIPVVIMVLESAHVVSPIILAWSHPGLRRIIRREWLQHIVLPLLVVAAAILAPIQYVFGLYWTWNIYHFGMQNFGVWMLWRPGCTPDARTRRALLALAVTTCGMAVVPLFAHGLVVWLMLTVVFDLSHWLIDIGLSSKVSRRACLFLPIVLAIGVAWLLLRQGPLSVRALPSIIAFRYGIGFVHFMYSARIWRLRDPQIREVVTQGLGGATS